MPFCYYTRPLANQNRYTGQPSYQPMMESDEAVALLVERTGLSEAQVSNVIEKLGQLVVETTMDCRRVSPILGWFGFNPTCGGSHPSEDFAPTFDNLAVDLRLVRGKEAELKMREIFTAQNTGQHGKAAPVVVRVTNMHTDQANTYTPGKPLQLAMGRPLCVIDPTQTTQGVFFVATNGTVVRAVDYGYNKGKVVSCVVPTGLTGSQQLCVKGVLYGTVRTGIYSETLTLEAAAADASGGNGRAGKGGDKTVVLRS